MHEHPVARSTSRKQGKGRKPGFHLNPPTGAATFPAMSSGRIITTALILLTASIRGHSAEIVWVGGDLTYQGTNYTSHLVNDLGHTVTNRFDLETLDAGKLADLNAADLVIMGRHLTFPRDYADSGEPTQWNGVTTPILNLSTWLCRKDHWDWLDSTRVLGNLDETLTVLESSDPAFTGMGLTPGSVLEAYIARLDFLAFMPNTGSGTQVAKTTTNDIPWIVRWEPGAPFHPTSTQAPSGTRVYFSAPPRFAFLTAEGRQIFDNLVESLINPPVHYDVYLVAGQSNMDGRGWISNLTGPLATWNSPQPDVRIHYRNPINNDPTNPTYDTGWINLAPGLSAPPGFSDPLPSSRFGPSLSFARTMADRAPERRVAVIKVPRGGTNLHTQWHPDESGNVMWRTFTNAIPEALQTLTNSFDTATLRGMIWHQGESDAGNADFQADLTRFLQATRDLVGDPEFPIVLGELERDPSNPTRTFQNDIFATVSASDPFTGLASSSGLGTSDGTHFDAAAVIDLGIRYADLMHDLDQDDLPDFWERTYLGSITTSSGGPREDFDGDGSPDADELRAGTHPGLESDVFRALGGTTTDPELRWSSTRGRVYRVLQKTSWDGTWSTFQDNVLATPPENIEILPSSPAEPDLYRVELVSP